MENGLNISLNAASAEQHKDHWRKHNMVHTHSHNGVTGTRVDYWKMDYIPSFSILSIYLSIYLSRSIYLVVVVSREKLLFSYESLRKVTKKLLNSRHYGGGR